MIERNKKSLDWRKMEKFFGLRASLGWELKVRSHVWRRLCGEIWWIFGAVYCSDVLIGFRRGK